MSQLKKCLQCEKPVHRRGLCTTHYSRYDNARKRLSGEQQRVFEETLVKAGLLLPIVTRRLEEDPYSDLASLIVTSDSIDSTEALREMSDKFQKANLQDQSKSDAKRLAKRQKKKGMNS